MFDDFPRDDFYFSSEETKTAIFSGIFTNNKLYIDNVSMPDVDGFTAHRVLPNGREEVYTVSSSRFQKGYAEFSDCYIIEIKKAKEEAVHYRNQIIINDSKGVQIGDNNTQYNIDAIVIGLKTAIDSINKSNATEEQKGKLKSLLKDILSNETFSAIIGSAAGGLMDLLK